MLAKPGNYDLIIAGGGTTGICLALSLLETTPLRIAIVESHDLNGPTPHPGFDSRSVALAAKSISLLEQFGIEGMASFGCPIKHIHVSDKGHLGQCLIHADEYQLGAVGNVVELHELGNKLTAQIKDADTQRLSWFRPDSIQQVSRTREHVEVRTAKGHSLRASLLVIAEGGNSPTRELMGMSVERDAYQQTAIIANINVGKPHLNWAFERFTESGPLAMLPLHKVSSQDPYDRCSLVWTVKQHQAQEILSLNDQAFLQRLSQEFGSRLGSLKEVGKRDSYPLSLVKAPQLTSHRVALVGNAAQTLHPIAGQGLNLALRDIHDIAEEIKRSLVNAEDIGSYHSLRRYEKKRTADRGKVISLTDSLVRVFSNQHLPLVMGRNIGLNVMNVVPAVKSLLANQAMGRHTHATGKEEPGNFKEGSE